MKKIIAIVVMIIVFCMLLIGCANTSVCANNDRFLFHSYNNGCCIIVDTQTKVMYLFINAGYEGGLTVMVDTDGRPLLYGESD